MSQTPHGGQPSRPDIRAELLRLRERDQHMRRTIGERYTNPDEISAADQEWWMQVDGDNTRRMRDIVTEIGWPGVSLVGDDGADAAWVLVLHADQNPAFQRRCVKLLEQAVAEQEARPEQLAFLTDRLLVNTTQPQLYGTQMTMVVGRIEPWPIFEPDKIDERRTAIGLAPLESYLAEVRASYEPGDA